MSLQPFLANRATATGKTGGVPQPATGETFQRLFGDTERTASADSQHNRPDGPKVEFVEEHGRVARIVVTCRCCERIELDCQY